MMNLNTIQGYLGGGYVQPRGDQSGGNVQQLLARLKAGRKMRAGEDAIADATTSAQSAKDKMLGWGKGLAGLASIAAPAVSSAILPASGLLGGPLGMALVAGGMGALAKYGGEKAGAKFAEEPEAVAKGTWGQKQLDKIKEYRAGLTDETLGRSLATGAVAGVTAGVGDYMKGLKEAKELGKASKVAGDTARASELYQQAGSYTPSPTADKLFKPSTPSWDVSEWLSKQNYDIENRGMDYWRDDNLNTLLASNQQGGLIGYQEGGLTSLLSMLSGANKGQEQIEDIEQSDAPMVDMDRVLAMSNARKKMSPEARESVDMGAASIPIPRPRRYAERVKERNRNLMDEYGDMKTAISRLSFDQLQDAIPKYQEGGMTPQRNNYRGGGLISMVPFARRIV